MISRMVDIDSTALKVALAERNLTYTEVSEELGYDASMMSRCLKTGRVSKILLKGLELRYGIRSESIIIPEKEDIPDLDLPVREPEQETAIDYEKLAGIIRSATPDPIDYGHLKSVVYEAVYEAVRKAWSE